MSDELQQIREQTAELERQAHDARYRSAVIAEAGERLLDPAVALELVAPAMFVLDDGGTPLNVKEILDSREASIRRAAEQKATAAEAAERERLQPGGPGAAAKARMEARLRRRGVIA